jgi:hypothetical protein
MPQGGAGGFLVCGISRRAMRPRLRRLVHFLDRLEINALLVAPDQNTWFGHRDHALLLLVVQTGLRLSELTGLQRMTWPWAREPMSLRGQRAQRAMHAAHQDNSGGAEGMAASCPSARQTTGFAQEFVCLGEFNSFFASSS